MTRAGSRAVITLLGLLALWGILAAARPDVTYHLAPAVVAWGVPWVHGGTRRAGLVASAAGVLGALLGAVILRAAGWLAGPALVGGDAFGEAVLVALGAGVLAAVAIAVTSRERAQERRALRVGADDRR